MLHAATLMLSGSQRSAGVSPRVPSSTHKYVFKYFVPMSYITVCVNTNYLKKKQKKSHCLTARLGPSSHNMKLIDKNSKAPLREKN